MAGAGQELQRSVGRGGGGFGISRLGVGPPAHHIHPEAGMRVWAEQVRLLDSCISIAFRRCRGHFYATDRLVQAGSTWPEI